MEEITCDAIIMRMYEDGRLRDFSTVLEIMKEFTHRTKHGSFRDSITLRDFQFLASFLQESVEALHSQKDLALECCTECVRCFRNACVQCVKNQDTMSKSGLVATETRRLLLFLFKKERLDEPQLILMRCCIQFLNNLASGHPDGQELVWNHILHDSMPTILSVHDDKVTLYCCMLLQTCLQNPDCRLRFQESAEAAGIMESVLSACSIQSELDFSLQLVQMVLQSIGIVSKIFGKLKIPSQIVLLHIANACVDESIQVLKNQQQMGVSESTLTCFAELFRKTSHNILSLAMKDSQDDDQKPQLVMSLVELLSAASAHPELQGSLQGMDFLLETSLELLDMVEQVGRGSDNAFSVRQDITGTSQEAELASEPGYGFKRNMVQLIGNMCFRHKRNQDKVRELKGIPVILQQCNIDCKNAFINQWAILAIRNLCEDNPENQAIILSMKSHGVADNEALAKLGYEAMLRNDGQVYLKNIKKT